MSLLRFWIRLVVCGVAINRDHSQQPGMIKYIKKETKHNSSNVACFFYYFFWPRVNARMWFTSLSVFLRFLHVALSWVNLIGKIRTKISSANFFYIYELRRKQKEVLICVVNKSCIQEHRELIIMPLWTWEPCIVWHVFAWSDTLVFILSYKDHDLFATANIPV